MRAATAVSWRPWSPTAGCAIRASSAMLACRCASLPKASEARLSVSEAQQKILDLGFRQITAERQHHENAQLLRAEATPAEDSVGAVVALQGHAAHRGPA